MAWCGLRLLAPRVRACMRAHICVCVHAYACVRTYAYACVRAHMCMRVCAHMRMHAWYLVIMPGDHCRVRIATRDWV